MAFYSVATADNSSFALNIIDYAHHEVHSGSSYFVREVSELASGAARTLVMITPDTAKWAHFVLESSSTAELSIVMTEGATVSGGTEITVVNRNRNSTNTAGVVVKHTPDSASGGTSIEVARVGSGRNIGGEARGLEELVLKQNTTYTLLFTNETNTDNVLNVVLSWYEHEDKL